MNVSNPLKDQVITKKQSINACQLSKKNCHNINRILVVLLTLAGIVSSGVVADIMVMVAVILWLWLPECDSYLSHSRKLQQALMLVAPALFFLLSFIAHR